MRYTTLASGSSGNCSYVESNDTKILIDAGMTGRKVERGLESLGINPRQVDALVVTHEHIDHVRGVGVLARRYGMRVLATEGTWAGMAGLVGDIPEEQIYTVSVDEKVAVKNLEMEVFPTPHDARSSIGLTFDDGKKRLGLATDAGYVTRGMGRRLTGCEAVILESNHDPLMLQEGPYPWYLKKRISGMQGHLSNQAAGEALVKLCDTGTRQVLLAHLSEENNHPEVAAGTVGNILKDHGYRAERQSLVNGRATENTVRLHVASRYEAHALEEI